jgi:hypothetical protein
VTVATRSWPLGCWDRGFESRSGHECSSIVFVCLLSCVGRSLCDELITRRKESYPVSNKDSRTQRRHRKTSIDVLTREKIQIIFGYRPIISSGAREIDNQMLKFPAVTLRKSMHVCPTRKNAHSNFRANL